MSSISLIQPDRDLFSGRSTGPPVLDRHRFCRCLVKRWINLAGIAATSFWLLATRMSITQASDGDLRSYAGSAGLSCRIIAQPDWSSKDDFMRLGKPNLFSVLLLATWIR